MFVCKFYFPIPYYFQLLSIVIIGTNLAKIMNKLYLKMKTIIICVFTHPINKKHKEIICPVPMYPLAYVVSEKELWKIICTVEHH